MAFQFKDLVIALIRWEVIRPSWYVVYVIIYIIVRSGFSRHWYCFSYILYFQCVIIRSEEYRIYEFQPRKKEINHHILLSLSQLLTLFAEIQPITPINLSMCLSHDAWNINPNSHRKREASIGCTYIYIYTHRQSPSVRDMQCARARVLYSDSHKVADVAAIYIAATRAQRKSATHENGSHFRLELARPFKISPSEYSTRTAAMEKRDLQRCMRLCVEMHITCICIIYTRGLHRGHTLQFLTLEISTIYYI